MHAAARQGARADRVAGFEIGFDDPAESIAGPTVKRSQPAPCEGDGRRGGKDGGGCRLTLSG